MRTSSALWQAKKLNGIQNLDLSDTITLACKQSPFEDSGGVVSTTVDDGLT